jgi:hypothetical protein
MEWRDIAMSLFGLFCTALGWVVREVWGAVDTLRKDHQAFQRDHQAFQTYIADKYARKDDVASMAENIMTFLRRIEDKLDGKQDK